MDKLARACPAPAYLGSTEEHTENRGHHPSATPQACTERQKHTLRKTDLTTRKKRRAHAAPGDLPGIQGERQETDEHLPHIYECMCRQRHTRVHIQAWNISTAVCKDLDKRVSIRPPHAALDALNSPSGHKYPAADGVVPRVSLRLPLRRSHAGPQRIRLMRTQVPRPFRPFLPRVGQLLCLVAVVSKKRNPRCNRASSPTPLPLSRASLRGPDPPADRSGATGSSTLSLWRS